MTAGAPPRRPWMVSLHGGHSGEFCEHAAGTLEEVLEAAVARGFGVFGVTEHAPRSAARFLYPEEVEKGWSVGDLERDFTAYAGRSAELAAAFAGRLTVLRGFEAEVVPEASWAREMAGHRRRHRFDYTVGSVHHVDEVQIDGRPEQLAEVVRGRGGLAAAEVAYYRAVERMVETLRPEVVAHFDLIRKLAAPFGRLDGAAGRRAAERALQAVAAAGSILDVNTAGLRTGLGHPYPAPWIVRRAAAMGIPFCFGDDSHGPAMVGDGIEAARDYLLAHGVGAITVLERGDGALVHRAVSLEP